MNDPTSARFDFFEVGALPSPRLGADEAAEIARRHFGVDARTESLGSQQDANFVLYGSAGEIAGVLKITNEAWGAADIDAQEAAVAFLAGALPDLRLPVSRPGPAGDPVVPVELAAGGRALARIGAHLAGGTLHGSAHLSSATTTALGRLCARVSVALQPFDHPALDHTLQWDLQHADRVVALLAPHVRDVDRRQAVVAGADAAWARVQEVADRLPRQALHGDLTDDNVVRALPGTGTGADAGIDLIRGGPIDGIIDLGDVTRSWAVAELAVTVASLLHHDGATPQTVLAAVAGFDAVRPLTDDEITALWPLVVLRGATLVVSGHQQVGVDGANDYAAGALEREWQIFAAASSVPLPVMETLVRARIGRPTDTARIGAGALVDPTDVELLDLTVESDDLDAGRWLEPGTEDRVALAALDAGAPAAATRFGEARLTLATLLSPTRPATVATGIDVWWAQDTALTSPWTGTVTRTGGGLRLVAADGTGELRLGLDEAIEAIGSPRTVAPGDLLLTAPARRRVRVTALRPSTSTSAPDVVLDLPPAVDPDLFAAWRSLVADPSGLLGLTTAATRDDEGTRLLQRRNESFASVQEHFYATPPHIERGWRHFLVDDGGWPLLDMVNNVAILGHGHPALADAVARQWRRLNTNSRFHYASVVEFSERLAGLLPEPLDTVFLVNSGSEANDLALRIALAATGRQDLVALQEAYHGWTFISDAVSTSVADNPNALTTRPDWVHTVDAPNSYRGVHRGDDAYRYAVDAAARVDELAAAGRAPAAFISETYYGNAGGMPLPEGYLATVYDAVHRHGGLTIADEVQVGYARLGEWFWGFEEQGVVPDIVTVAKAMGNGQPLGAVVTSREVAEAYRRGGYFFSSAGGSPVSSVVGLAVLDAMESEGLRANARAVGAHIKARLLALAEQHPIIGAVHGTGLYQGIELVRDRETLEPAPEETAAICDRMRELGIIVQPTSDRLNVLKVKPPLCIDEEAADFFVDTLDQVLTNGW